MTSSLDKHIVELKREYPEWQPWLAVVHEILDETVNPVWDAIVPVRTGPQQRKVPLLTGMTLNVEQSLIGRLLEQLIRVASTNGTAKMATLKTALHADFDILSLFKASLCHDSDHIKELRQAYDSAAGLAHAYEIEATTMSRLFDLYAPLPLKDNQVSISPVEWTN